MLRQERSLGLRRRFMVTMMLRLRMVDLLVQRAERCFLLRDHRRLLRNKCISTQQGQDEADEAYQTHTLQLGQGVRTKALEEAQHEVEQGTLQAGSVFVRLCRGDRHGDPLHLDHRARRKRRRGFPLIDARAQRERVDHEHALGNRTECRETR